MVNIQAGKFCCYFVVIGTAPLATFKYALLAYLGLDDGFFNQDFCSGVATIAIFINPMFEQTSSVEDLLVLRDH